MPSTIEKEVSNFIEHLEKTLKLPRHQAIVWALAGLELLARSLDYSPAALHSSCQDLLERFYKEDKRLQALDGDK